MIPQASWKVLEPVTEAPEIVEEPSSMRVHEMLKESLMLHHAAKGKSTEERRSLHQRAHLLRTQAHELDPEHKESVWAEEQTATPRGYDTHNLLMEFYKSI